MHHTFRASQFWVSTIRQHAQALHYRGDSIKSKRSDRAFIFDTLLNRAAGMRAPAFFFSSCPSIVCRFCICFDAAARFVFEVWCNWCLCVRWFVGLIVNIRRDTTNAVENAVFVHRQSSRFSWVCVMLSLVSGLSGLSVCLCMHRIYVWAHFNAWMLIHVLEELSVVGMRAYVCLCLCFYVCTPHPNWRCVYDLSPNRRSVYMLCAQQ